jgi:aryl carrier-like protein
VAELAQSDHASIIQHQHTALRAIQRWLGFAGPLFSSLFSFNRIASTRNTGQKLWEQIDNEFALDVGRFYDIDADQADDILYPKYPFALAVEADSATDTLTVRAAYAPEFSSNTDVALLLDRLLDLLSDTQQSISPPPGRKVRSVNKDRHSDYDETRWSPHELLIRDVVADACQVDVSLVTKGVSFLHLGIDSIAAIRLAQRLRSRGVSVQSHAIMRYPCVAALAEHLSQPAVDTTAAFIESEFLSVQASLQNEHLPAIPRLSDSDEILALFPATHLQAGMLTQTLASDGRFYLVHHTLRLDSKIDLDKLRFAWESVVASTDILRCSFHAFPEGRFPWVAAIHSRPPLRWIQRSFASSNELRSAAEELVEEASIKDEHGFARPPISFHLLSAADLSIFVVMIHHRYLLFCHLHELWLICPLSLYDGISLSYIFDDVASAYHGSSVEARPQFLQVVPHILHRPRDETEFWQRRLAGFVPAAIPRKVTSARPSRANVARRSFQHSFSVTGAAKAMGITLHSAALLAW